MLQRNEFQSFLDRRNNDETVIDVHTHSGVDNYNIIHRRYPTVQSVKDLVMKLNATGVDFAVNFPCAASYYYIDLETLVQTRKFVPTQVEAYPHEKANQQMMYEISLFGSNQLLPFSIVFPKFELQKQIERIYELAEQDILFGIKLHTLGSRSPITTLANTELIGLAERFSLPFMVHTGPDKYSLPQHVVEMALQYPRVRFCAAHVGRFEKTLYDSLQEHSLDNLFIDTSPFISLCRLTPEDIQNDSGGEKLDLDYCNPQQALQDIVKLYGRHLLWGTDEPWTTITDDRQQGIVQPIDYRDEVELLRSLPASTVNTIAYRNTYRFLFGEEAES